MPPSPRQPFDHEGLDLLRSSWVRSLRSAHKSDNTISMYNEGARQFIQFLAAPPESVGVAGEESAAELLARLPIVDESSIRRDHCEAFIGHLLTKVKPATASARYSGISSWFAWMVKQPDVDVEVHPMTGMQRPAIPEVHPKLIPRDSIRALLDTCDLKTFGGVRDHAIIRCLADTGVRIGELIGAKRVEVIGGDRVPFIDLDTESIYVMGKGRRPRTVAFGPRTADAIDRYLRARRKHRHADRMELWLPATRHVAYKPLRQAGVRSMLDRRCDRANVEHVHPHLFRHSWADFQKASGLDRGALKNQGGWRSDAMLDRYGAVADNERSMMLIRRSSFGDTI